jgi:hypothetical protein
MVGGVMEEVLQPLTVSRDPSNRHGTSVPLCYLAFRLQEIWLPRLSCLPL